MLMHPEGRQKTRPPHKFCASLTETQEQIPVQLKMKRFFDITAGFSRIDLRQNNVSYDT